jgi:glycosyltransferase involved in cell wall biosynthesis
MRILHLVKKYPNVLGGDAVVVYNLEKHLRKLGHEVFILSSNCSEIRSDVLKFGLKEKPQNLDRITFRRVLSLFFLIFWGFRHLNKLRPDVVHSHSADLGFFISIPARFYGVPVVNTCHGVSFPYPQYSYFKRLAEKFFLKYGGFSRIISVDKSSLAHFRDAGIDNVVYIPNGVDVEEFQGERKRGERFRFLFVGRLEKQKGLRYLVEAVSRLRGHDFEVLIVGEGSQEKNLRKLVEELGVKKRIRFTGEKQGKELVELYLSSDAFILPSTWEGLPLTVLEAWAAGLPVIATSVGGIKSICVDHENSLVVEPRDSVGLAKAMEELIEDNTLRDKLATNARKKVVGFSWEEISKRILEVYREMKYPETAIASRAV